MRGLLVSFGAAVFLSGCDLIDDPEPIPPTVRGIFVGMTEAELRDHPEIELTADDTLHLWQRHYFAGEVFSDFSLHIGKNADGDTTMAKWHSRISEPVFYQQALADIREHYAAYGEPRVYTSDGMMSSTVLVYRCKDCGDEPLHGCLVPNDFELCLSLWQSGMRLYMDGYWKNRDAMAVQQTYYEKHLAQKERDRPKVQF